MNFEGDGNSLIFPYTSLNTTSITYPDPLFNDVYQDLSIVFRSYFDYADNIVIQDGTLIDWALSNSIFSVEGQIDKIEGDPETFYDSFYRMSL